MSVPKNIWIAASDGDLEVVKSYLESGISVDAKDPYGYTPLSASVSYDHYDLATYLIEQGANVNIVDFDNETPLHHCESVRCAKLLIDAGANPNLKNNEGVYPYQTAYEEENIELYEYLYQLSEDKIELNNNQLQHVDYDGNEKEENDMDLNDEFINKFDQVMKDETFETEEERDKKLGDLVLNLLTDKVKSSNGDKKE
ncbi:ankyrin [Neoconidiobolus thromboides FSU 785]|nr:ankyrin [Neoconidiobolus thromboides FSU 785]